MPAAVRGQRITKARTPPGLFQQPVNAAINEEVARLNGRASRQLGASRQQLFATIELPAMLPLPPEPFVHVDWRHATVGVDYHVRLEGRHYSVPQVLIRQQLWARLTASTIEVFRGGKRIACHRCAVPGDTGTTTLNDHRPASHRRHAELTPETRREHAARIGPATTILFDVILRDRPHPEQGFRSCLGIRHPARSHAAERLEAASDRALVINARTMTSVKSILRNGLDGRRPIHPPEAPPPRKACFAGRGRRRSATPTSAAPSSSTEPKETTSLTHPTPRGVERARARRHGRGFRRADHRTPRPQPRSRRLNRAPGSGAWIGLMLDREQARRGTRRFCSQRRAANRRHPIAATQSPPRATPAWKT